MNSFTELLCSAGFFYPLYWLSLFLVQAAPALIHVLVLGHRLTSFWYSPMAAQAACAPPGSFAPSLRQADHVSVLLVSGIVLAASCLAATVFRRQHILSGFLIASLAQVASMRVLIPLLFQAKPAPSSIVASLLYAGLMWFGLRRMLTGEVTRGYGMRLASLALGFLLPVIVFNSVYARFGARPRYVLFSVIPAAVVAAIAAMPNSARIGVRADFTGWKWKRFGAGAAASLLLATGVHAGSSTRQKASAAALKTSLASIPRVQLGSNYPKLFFQKGVNFTAEGPVGYSPDPSSSMLDALGKYGVNAIALVPYGFARGTEVSPGYGGMERAELIEAVAALAHLRGMKVLLKPQIWVGGGGYPGNIQFRSAEDRTRWFQQYQRFLENSAALAARIHADLFCVGVEFVQLSHYEDEWRKLIARVRQLYPGPLVYAATQGPEFEGIRFWDALDYIGLNNYYPLPDDLSMDSIVRKIEEVQRRYQRPVIFTEAGFSSLVAPHKAPWDETVRTLSPYEQALCYEAVLRAFYKRPWFQGVYWWKVGTNGFGGPSDGSHTPWGKPAMDVVGKWYLRGGR